MSYSPALGAFDLLRPTPVLFALSAAIRLAGLLTGLPAGPFPLPESWYGWFTLVAAVPC